MGQLIGNDLLGHGGRLRHDIIAILALVRIAHRMAVERIDSPALLGSMQVQRVFWFCLAYIAGLAITELVMTRWPIAAQPLLSGLFITIGIGFEGLWWGYLRRWQPGRWPQYFGLTMSIVALIASWHLYLRDPQPGETDISRFVSVLEALPVQVDGTITSPPRLTRSQKMQFWLKVEGLEAGAIAPRLTTPQEQANGQLYVTVPQAIGVNLFPGAKVQVQGQLYQPRPANNPGGFDFQRFLKRSDSFAGMRGESVTIKPIKPIFSLWPIQQRIVRSQAAHLPSPHGALVSAMVLGSQGVDLPFEVKDQFAQVGLSHALAASGFQVSLILGVILAGLKSVDRRWQFGIGAFALLTFLGLTGFQPSVCRAVVMGFAALVGVLLGRRSQPLRALLVAVTLLLLINPIWISDLGFQFSVLATLGLLVTVPWLTEWLNWLPEKLIAAIAVPLAAFFWTLPLQLHTFGVLSPYSILINIITAPIITVISLGAMANALLAVVFPAVASWAAIVLQPFTTALLAIVQFATHLPHVSWAVGVLPLSLTLLLYGGLLALWWQPDWRQYGWAVGLAGAAVVWLPAIVLPQHLIQITALATSPAATLVIQDQGKVGLIDNSPAQTSQMTVLPFLQQQGVNQIDWAIALPESPAVKKLGNQLPIRQAHYLTPEQVGRSHNVGRSRWECVSQDPAVVSLRVQQNQWLLLPKTLKSDQQIQLAATLKPHGTLWWTGSRLRPELLQQLKPQVAIAFGPKLHPPTARLLQGQGIQVFWLKRDGAVQWQAQRGFQTVLTEGDAKGALL
jgi:competence protein ComEC